MSDRLMGAGLLAVFLMLILLIIAIGEMGMHSMDTLHADANSIAELQWMDVQCADEVLHYSNQNSQINMQVLLQDGQQQTASLLARRAQNSATISKLLARMRTRVDSEQEQNALDAILGARRAYLNSYRHATELFLAEKEPETARNLMVRETIPLLLSYHRAIEAYIDLQSVEMNRTLAQSAARYGKARHRAMLLLAISVFLSLAIAAFVVWKIMAEIRRREAAEYGLRRFNQQLESKVSQRTSDLERSNLALSAEVTERKRSEALVRRLSVAVEQCPVSVLITDLSGRISYANQKFLEITGYNLAEAIGQNPRMLKSGRTTLAVYQNLWRTIRAGKEWRGEFCNRKKDGTLYWEYAIIRPIRDEQGNISDFLAIKEDITLRRKMQAQLNQSQKLESIGQLAAGIAHEINTPMQFIGDNTRFVRDAWKSLEGLMVLLSSPACPAGDEAIPRRLVEAVAAADVNYLQKEVPVAIEQTLDGISRVSEIVRAMKEFSHPGGENKQLADINKAIETTIIVSRNEWKHVADLETTLSTDIGLIPCHVGEFNQVILNLLVNAAHAIAAVPDHASGTKGKITVQTTREQNWAQVAIHDTGCGIPLEIQSRIFDPFFTTKELGKGTGQGLALAHAVIVKKHGGSIWFESDERQGTTFFIRVPIKSSTADADSESEEVATSAGS